MNAQQGGPAGRPILSNALERRTGGFPYDRQIRRAAVVLLSALIASIGAIGWTKVFPAVRHGIEKRRDARQATLRETRAHAEWKREFGDPDRTLAAFPRQDDSEAAVRLISLARSVGISLARPEGKPRPWVESAAERDLREDVAEYVHAELARTGGDPEPPPDAVREFLEARGREVADIVDFLATSEPLAWKMDVLLGPEAPVPNVLPQLRLQRLLIAEALNRARSGGDMEGAERVFDASWALNTSLRDRPDVVSQLIAISIARIHVGLARRLSIDPARWRARLLEHDYRASLLRAMIVESVAGLPYLPTGSSPSDRASRADFLDIKRRFLVGLRDSPVSDGSLEIRGEKPPSGSKRSSEGAMIARLVLPTLAGSLRRVDRLIIDTELSAKVLDARMLRARLGRWPSAIPSLETSRMAGEHWTYRVDVDGGMTISFSRELQWENQAGLMLPLRYESH